MTKVLDPKGNELKPLMLQVVTSDERGPITLRLRHDDETIDLASATVEQRQFYVVYAPTDAKLAVTDWSKLLREVDELKEVHEAGIRERRAMYETGLSLQREVDAIVAENAKKTEALREMQRERDPERINALIKQAVNNATRTHEAELKVERAKTMALNIELATLRASKKKLKE